MVPPKGLTHPLFGAQFMTRRARPKDIVFTPDCVAREIVRFFAPSGRCLDPCAGSGAFLRYLPEGTKWCEITKGKDFFEWSEPVDWIVSNPPFTKFASWLEHSLEVAEHVVYLMPVAKLFNSLKMLRMIQAWGGIECLYMLGPGYKIRQNMGYVFAAVHLQRAHTGGMRLVISTTDWAEAMEEEVDA